jgi:hypothetical protein
MYQIEVKNASAKTYFERINNSKNQTNVLYCLAVTEEYAII